ncbi:hypothetical protein GGR56DRAFT_432790 [Xylariaceae sp. FL0804]|nr:hypothetical protein GGR56DRAFT_432790 [Xylariaceae sp. FL0804]
MPQLRFARLHLPSLCPESFGTVSMGSPAGRSVFDPIELPKLEECILVLASPMTVSGAERFDGSCTASVSLVGMPAVDESLASLVKLGRAPKITELWVYDCPPGADDDVFDLGAFVRRDVLARKNITFPRDSVLAWAGVEINGFFV